MRIHASDIVVGDFVKWDTEFYKCFKILYNSHGCEVEIYLDGPGFWCIWGVSLSYFLDVRKHIYIQDTLF